ncbi:MAG: VCBS repeat-containing protein, partial [Rhodothermales bacterium]
MSQFQRSSAFAFLLMVFLWPLGNAQAQFTDVASSVGINVTHDGASVADMGLGAGAAWFDYDNDGDLDLYMTMRTGANFLFQNNAGSFTDVAAAAGVADASNDGAGVAAADYNNDGCIDLYLANSIIDVLFENNCDGTFTDIYAGSGLETSGERRGTSASWGDYDNDGFVDLYVAHHYPLDGTNVPDDKSKGQDYLYHNNGDGTFTDVTDDMLGDDREKASFMGSWTDYDNDGDLDIYMIADCPFDAQAPMRLWRNDGGTDGVTDWTFTDVAGSANANWCQNGMGLAVGDYDRDGFQDYFYTDNGNLSGAGGLERAGTLLLNNNGSTFSDATDAAGVSSNNFSWGANFFDYDLDGWEDLFMAAGSLNDFSSVESKLWHSDGNGISFTDVSVAQGVNDTGRGRSGVYADYDQDGDPDLFLVNYGGQARLFRNDNSNSNNWLIVDLEGVTSNHDGIGAKVELTSGSGTQTHEIHSGSSLGGGDDVAAYFGLGTDASISNLTITWPSGTVQTVNGVGINQRILVVESTTTGGGDLFTDVTNSVGLNVTHQGNTTGDMGIGTGAAWFDYDQDGDLDLYMTNREGANHLFENNGGSFTDVAAAAGVADAGNDGSGVSAADYNNDGCTDLYLANSNADVLFENNCDGTFTDITTGSGLEASEERRGTSASWGDYDGDGFVDLYVSHHMPFSQTFTGDGEQDYLFHNDGGTGNFTDVSDMLLGADRMGRAFISGWTDYDNDSDLDVFLIADCPFGQNSAPMRLFRNDGGTNGTTDWNFTETSETVGTDWCQNGMGLAIGDYNRDGWMDFFFTDNGATTTEYPSASKRVGSVLLRNDSGTFTETTDAAQVDNNHFSWGSNFFDYDLDGWQDLFMVGGAMAPENLVENILWNNDGDGTFSDVSSTAGGLNDGSNTRTSAYGDYDGDGDMDMFIVNYNQGVKLFRNDNNNGNNHFIVDLQGVSSNR